MRIAALDLWRVYSIIYYGMPTVMASYDFPDKRSGPMRYGMNSMAENFAEYNFAPTDRYAKYVSDVASRCAVELVESGLTVQFEGNGCFPGCATPDREWIDLAKSRLNCLVVLTVGDVEADDVQGHLRRQMGNKLSRAALVPFVDLRTEGFDPATSRYKFVDHTGVAPLPEPVSCAVSLDSNVVLDLEKAAQGKVPESLYVELQGLVRNLRYQDRRPGVAIGELCWSGIDGQYRVDREPSLLAAMDAWFDDRSPDGLSMESVNSRWLARQEYHRSNPTMLRDLDIRRLISVNYCCLLKLASLLLSLDGFKANQRIELFGEFCRWMNKDLGAILATPLQLAFDGIVGNPASSQYVRKLMKFSKNPLRNLWGAAWDLSILWLTTDLLAAGKSFNPLHMSPGLVTADKGLIEIRNRLHYQGLMQNAERTEDWRGVVAARYEWDARLAHQEPAIREIIANMQRSVVSRLDPENLNPLRGDALTAEIHQLETRVTNLMSKPSPPESAPSGESVTSVQEMNLWERVTRWFR